MIFVSRQLIPLLYHDSQAVECCTDLFFEADRTSEKCQKSAKKGVV